MIENPLVVPGTGSGDNAVKLTAPDANSYTTFDDFIKFLDVQNKSFTGQVTLPENPTNEQQAAFDAWQKRVYAAMLQASNIVDGIGYHDDSWKGNKVIYNQGRAWPRSGAVIDGALAPVNWIPNQLMKAQNAMTAYILDDPTIVDQIIDHNAVVKREKNFGQEIEYAIGEATRDGVTSNRSRYNQIEDLLGSLKETPTNNANAMQRGVGGVFDLSSA